MSVNYRSKSKSTTFVFTAKGSITKPAVMTPAAPQDGSATVVTTSTQPNNTHVQINISIKSNGDTTPSVSISMFL